MNDLIGLFTRQIEILDAVMDGCFGATDYRRCGTTPLDSLRFFDACRCDCMPVSPPEFEDSCHPSGSLKVDGNVITTPGGYQIEALGQNRFKITGPDGSSSEIWGDPHVNESDRNGNADWDFKNDSTFVLGDGTRINVSTKPGGRDGMTVTSSIEVISGNDRVVANLENEKPQISEVTHDGFQHVNSFGGKDVFVMGDNAADWTYQGREIIGSENGGESFKLGDRMDPAVDDIWSGRGNTSELIELFRAMLDLLRSVNRRPFDFGYHPYRRGSRSRFNLFETAMNQIADMHSRYMDFMGMQLSLLNRF
jgi:hypothetical protein